MSAGGNQRESQPFVRGIGVTVFLVGLLALAAWEFGFLALKGVFPTLPLTMPNTALGFVLAGGALRLRASASGSLLARCSGMLLAGLTAALGVVTLAEYLFSWDPGLDRLLFGQTLEGLGTALAGRPSVLTALGFALGGLSLMLLDVRRQQYRLLADVCAMVPVRIALLALIGYACGVPSFYGWRSLYPGTAMSLLTAVTFVILGAGSLAAHRDRGLMRVLAGSTAGSLVARRLLLAPVVIPLVTGLLGIALRRMGVFNVEVVGWSFSFFNIFIFTAVIWWVAVLLHASDTVRLQAEAGLREAKERLELRVTERTAELTRASEALARSERRFRALIEHGSDSIAIINAENKILYVSPAVETVEGYTPEELLGRSGLENTHPDDLPIVGRIVQQLLANPGKPIPVLWRRRHKDGRWLWLEGVATNLLDDPAVGAIVTNYRDVTERKVAEAELRRYVEELRTRNEELERFNRATTGREMRMVELKRQVNELAGELGRPEVYRLSFAAGTETETGIPTLTSRAEMA